MRGVVGVFFVVCAGLVVEAASSISISPSPNAYGWNNTPVTVAINGDSPVFWQVDGGPISSAPAPVVFLLAEEGVHVVRYRDNSEPAFKQATIRLDFTPPEIHVRVPEPGGEYIIHQPVLADWSAWDRLSGLAEVKASAGNGEPVDTRSPGQAKFTVWAKDRAGNEAQSTVMYFVRGLVQAVLPSGFYLDRVLPPEETIKVGKYLLRARYTQGEDVVFAFVMKDYFGRPFTRAGSEISVVRVRFVNEEEEYPLVKWLRVPFDAEKACYLASFSTKELEPGFYDLWVLFGDGKFERIRVEILPKS